MATFSFYANKLVTTGEGGMVVTDDEATAEFIRRERNLWFEPPRRFRHSRLGHNHRMTNLQAAIGLAQVERIDEIVATKRRMGQAYNERLADIDGLQLPVERPWAQQVYWMYGVVLGAEHDFDAAEFSRRLSELGVQTRPFFLGMHEQPALRERGWYADESYPVTERIARRGIYLPSGLTITESQIDQVSAAVRAVLS